MNVVYMLTATTPPTPQWEILMNLEFWQILAAAIGSLVGITALIPKIRKSITKPIAAYIKLMVEAPTLLQNIHHQLHNNGGSSMLDKVDRIETNVAAANDNIRDVEKRLESKINAVENRLYVKTLLESDAKFWSDEHGKTTNVNGAYQKLMNCTLQDVIGYNFVNKMLDNETATDYLAAWDRAVKTGSEFVRDVKIKGCLADSSECPIRVSNPKILNPLTECGRAEVCPFILHVHAVPIKDEQGVLQGYEGVVRRI